MHKFEYSFPTGKLRVTVQQIAEKLKIEILEGLQAKKHSFYLCPSGAKGICF